MIFGKFVTESFIVIIVACYTRFRTLEPCIYDVQDTIFIDDLLSSRNRHVEFLLSRKGLLTVKVFQMNENHRVSSPENTKHKKVI
jgi:hypothetical protein